MYDVHSFRDVFYWCAPPLLPVQCKPYTKRKELYKIQAKKNNRKGSTFEFYFWQQNQVSFETPKYTQKYNAENNPGQWCKLEQSQAGAT